MEFAVLMSCYKNDNSKYLDVAIKSSYINQTLKPNAFYIIVDGPVGVEINNVINKYSTLYPKVFKILRLPQNLGLGKALRYGIENCEYEYIIRMDSDDISRKDRFQKIISFYKKNPIYDVIGSCTAEFNNECNEITSIRFVHKNMSDILNASKKKSPVSHVSVFFKKSSVIDSGNYLNFLYYEDYYLWIRMLIKDKQFYNIQDVLVFVRTDASRYKRKGCKEYRKSTISFQKYLYRIKYISFFEFVSNLIIRLIVAFSPTIVKKFIYEKILRKKPNKIENVRNYNLEIKEYES